MEQNLRRESRNVFAIILALQLLTSFGAIALLARMGPAIATVVEENVESMTAVEEMIATLAGASGSDEAAHRTFMAAYNKAENNVTEAEERPLLAEIRANSDAALAGDTNARKRILSASRQLAEVNREALFREDREVQRLAEAGAWAAVVLGLTAFVFVRYVAGRVDRSVVAPILEIADTLAAHDMGDRYRRCSTESRHAEIQSIADGVDRLLDRTDPGKGPEGPGL